MRAPDSVSLDGIRRGQSINGVVLRAAYEDIVMLRYTALDPAALQRVDRLLKYLASRLSLKMGIPPSLRRGPAAPPPPADFVVIDQRSQGKACLGFLRDRALTIGRPGWGNDIDIFRKSADGVENASRLHALLIPDPEKGKWIIADLGALCGFKITHRMRGSVMVEVRDAESESTFDRRCPLLVDWLETLVLDLNNGACVLFNPKPCARCKTATPVCLGPCGFAIFCASCFSSPAPPPPSLTCTMCGRVHRLVGSVWQ